MNGYGDTGWYKGKPEERFRGGAEAPTSYAAYDVAREKAQVEAAKNKRRGWLSFAEPDTRGALSLAEQGGELSL